MAERAWEDTVLPVVKMLLMMETPVKRRMSDEELKAVLFPSLLKPCVVEGDTVDTIGGQTFVVTTVLLEGYGSVSLPVLAERIRYFFETDRGGRPISVGTSVHLSFPEPWKKSQFPSSRVGRIVLRRTE